MKLMIAHITIDCAHADVLASFWSELLGRPVDDGASDVFATIGLADAHRNGPALMFIQVPETKAAKNRVHLDLHASAWRDEARRAVGLGATHVADHEEFGTAWSTLLDPEGNEFDIGAGFG